MGRGWTIDPLQMRVHSPELSVLSGRCVMTGARLMAVPLAIFCPKKLTTCSFFRVQGLSVCLLLLRVIRSMVSDIFSEFLRL